MFKKGQKVVKIINVKGIKSATVAEVESVKKKVVRLVDAHSEYNAETGAEIEAPMASMGIYSEIIMFDGGEVERLGL